MTRRPRLLIGGAAVVLLLAAALFGWWWYDQRDVRELRGYYEAEYNRCLADAAIAYTPGAEGASDDASDRCKARYEAQLARLP